MSINLINNFLGIYGFFLWRTKIQDMMQYRKNEPFPQLRERMNKVQLLFFQRLEELNEFPPKRFHL